MIDDVSMQGGCNCGEVRYVITRPLLTAYICHCHLCQKRTGSAFSMSIVVPADGLRIIKGKPIQTQRSLASGTKNISCVCTSCYSRLYTRRDAGRTINVRAGTLDDTSMIKPVAQFWTESAQPWALVSGDILSYAEQPTDYAPLLAKWKALMNG